MANVIRSDRIGSYGAKRMTSERHLEDRYLDLLKKALSFLLWPDPPIPVSAIAHRRPIPARLWERFLTGLVGRQRDVVLYRDRSEEERATGRGWPAYAHTMIGLKRLDHLQWCIERILAEGIEGDLIESGVWRGGASIFMRAVLAVHDETERRVFVADSFAGLPRADADRYPSDRGDRHHRWSFLSVPKTEVEANFRRFGLLDEQVVFLEGWFKDTLPTAPMEKLSLLRADGDLYESTMDVLRNLYPKLSVGGFCIIDDYALKPCREAVTDFRAEHGIDDEMLEIDWTGRYWRKSG